MDRQPVENSIWIIRALRRILEKRIESAQDFMSGNIAVAQVTDAYREFGVVTLCLELIAEGVDNGLQSEALSLLIDLLKKEGGAMEIQTEIFEFLYSNPEFFFHRIHCTIDRLIAWHKVEESVEGAVDKLDHLPDDIHVLKFLQLMCEGHFEKNQDLLREQDTGSKSDSVNLLDNFVEYLSTLSRMPSRLSTQVGSYVASLILEVIQGPCEGNQVHFALNTDLIETLNRLLRAKSPESPDFLRELDIKLKSTVVDIFQALCEGQSPTGVVYDRILSVIHLDILQTLALEESRKVNEEGDEVVLSPAEILTNIRRNKCIVLIRMLCDARSTLHDEYAG
jgi:hypothetical protein